VKSAAIGLPVHEETAAPLRIRETLRTGPAGEAGAGRATGIGLLRSRRCKHGTIGKGAHPIGSAGWRQTSLSEESQPLVAVDDPIAGCISLIWFLLRVVPKPSRAAYPCQRVAAPLAGGFLVWLAGLIGSVFAYRKAGHLLRQSRLAMACFCLAVAVAMGIIALINMPERMVLADPPVANSPIGTAKGIIPDGGLGTRSQFDQLERTGRRTLVGEPSHRPDGGGPDDVPGHPRADRPGQ